MNKKYIKYIVSVLLIISITFMLNIKFGRSIPNPYEKPTTDQKSESDVNLIYSFSDSSKKITLGKQNLITGAYAKRTMFIIEINQEIDDISKLKDTKFYLNENIIQSDNLFYGLNNTTYGIIVVDNTYTQDDLLEMKIVNEDIFDEELGLKNKNIETIKNGLVEVNDLFEYKGAKYFRLPNNKDGMISFLPLEKGADNLNYFTESDLITINIDSLGEINNLCKANLLESNMQQYVDDLSSVSLISISFYEDFDKSKVGVKLIDTDLFIPLDDNIIRYN